ncbi:hypothetical protein QJS66_09395 [Kocuria rhizophila]|nr:hypothetical protein QJS66_09395 [Kocuria rhizophila]
MVALQRWRPWALVGGEHRFRAGGGGIPVRRVMSPGAVRGGRLRVRHRAGHDGVLRGAAGRLALGRAIDCG